MTQAANTILSLILTLYHLIVRAIGTAEHALRQGLNDIGVGGPIQELILILVAVLFVIAALQLFGRLFAVLIALFLILVILHDLVAR